MAGHREIMAALSARDADGARRAMEEHLDEVAALIALSAGAADDPAPPP
jgi:DNA-binding FadR family transcriptional regulator